METVKEVAAAAGQDIAGNNPVPNLNQTQVQRPVDDLSLWEAKKQREASTSTMDYATAALHQDDFLNGFIANHVGDEMASQPGFNILDDKTWKQYTDGLPESLKPEMMSARSDAHAVYLRSLIDDKMREQTTLGDLGWKGNTLRVLGGFIEPGNLAVMAGSMGLGAIIGGGGALARANKALMLTREMAEGPARVAAVAKATEQLAAAANEASTAKSAAATVAGAAGINAGMEALRQKYNFEDDPAGILHAGLMGTVLGLPIAGLRMHEMARLREAAGAEGSVLNLIQSSKAMPDAELSPTDAKNVATVDSMHNYIAEVMKGDKEIGELREPPLQADREAIDGGPRRVEKGTTYEGEFTRVADEPTPGEPKRLTGPAPEEAPVPKPKAEPGPHGEPPEEYLPDGVEHGSMGAAAVADAMAGRGIDPTYMRSGRLDIYATLNRNPNAVFQELAHVLVKDPIANSKTTAQGWSASELKRNIQRTLGGTFHTEAQGALTDAIKVMGVPLQKRPAFAKEFYKAVTAATRGDPDVLNQYSQIAPQITRASKAMKDVYARMLDRAQKAGVKGAIGVKPNDSYVNRVFKFSEINRLVREHGDQVHEMLSHAMPWLEGRSQVDRIAAAKSYLEAVRKLEYSHMSQDMLLHAHDMNTLRSELQRAGMDEAGINQVVDSMFEHKITTPDAGQAGNLKFRFKLDENYGQRMSNGETVKVSQLFENDSRVLMDKYLHSMAGHTALAEKGIKSRADFMSWMSDAEAVHKGSTNSVEQFTKDKQLLNDLYDHITGRPMSMQQFNTTDRLANSLRALTRSTVLGQLGVAAAFEMHKAIVLSGLRAALTQLPTLRATVNAVRKGHQFTDQLGRDIRTLWGFGSESAAAHAREHEVSDHPYDGWVSKVENFTNEASHHIDRLSGNAFFTAATREMATRFSIQKMANFASGVKKLTAKQRERLVGNGVDESSIDAMMRDVNKYTERDGDRVTSIRYEQWQQEHPHSFDNFQRVVEREVRDAIQEHDIGETMPWMHTTLGKVFAELRTFMLVGHAKSTLKALHYRDATSASQLMFGIVSEVLSYSLQTSLNYAQNPKELQRRLDPTYMGKMIFQRMSLMGALPMVAGTAAQTFGIPLEVGTVNTDNRNAFSAPSFSTVRNLMTAAQVAGQAVNPWSNTVTTDKEMRTALEAFPGGNLWVMRNVADWMSQGHPKHDPRQQ